MAEAINFSDVFPWFFNRQAKRRFKNSIRMFVVSTNVRDEFKATLSIYLSFPFMKLKCRLPVVAAMVPPGISGQPARESHALASANFRHIIKRKQ